MTRLEFDEFKKEFRELRDLTVRLDEKMENVKAALKDGHNEFDDHDKRIRVLENFKITIIAYAIAASTIITIAFNALKSFFFK